MDYVVVMAGGTGKRLWPLSREKRPKQVLKLFDGQTLLRRCFQRLCPVFDTRNIIVLTNAGYADLVRENLPELPFNNVIAEPAVRDTAGAIGLAATVLTKADTEATMAVVTADQLIEPAETLQQVLEDALVFVNENPDDLITFGIKPTFASTQLGYIKCSKPRQHRNCKNKIYPVEAFKEKPDEKAAKEYLETGRYFWNSGMFVWKAKTILANLAKFLPQSAEPLAKIKADWDGPNQRQALQEWFPKLPKISIDYAVMEKSEDAIIALYKGAKELLLDLKLERVHVHCLGYYICVISNDYPLNGREVQDALLFAAAIAASKASRGFVESIDDVGLGLEVRVYQEGIKQIEILGEHLNRNVCDFSGGIGIASDHTVVVIPTKVVENPVATVGIGDVISASAFVAELSIMNDSSGRRR